MSDLLVNNPKTNFNESLPVAKNFLDDKELKTAKENKFAFDQASLKVGSQVGTKKGVVAVLRRVLPKSVVQPHLYVDGDRMPLKDVNVYDIIQAIQTAAVKPGSSETQSLLAARHSVPAWNEGIRSYMERMDKTEAILLKVGFRSDPSLQMNYLKLHVEEFSQTPQGKIFQQTIMN